jgi:lysine/ornithine N-monooxygenase
MTMMAKKSSVYLSNCTILLLRLMLLVLIACRKNSPHHHFTAVAYSTATTTSIRSSSSPCSSSSSSNRQQRRQDETTTTTHNINIPWLIVGGGIHGVHIAARLLGDGRPGNDVRIIDGNESLLHEWKSRTAATGMEYLRSSAGYHLDLDEHSLRREFGMDKSKKRKKKSTSSEKKKKNAARTTNDAFFTNDYERPRLDVFNQHCDSVVKKYELDRLHTQGIVTAIEPTEEHVKVTVSIGSGDDEKEENNNIITYTAQNVVLALGNDKPSYADWVDEEDVQNGFVYHLLENNYREKQQVKKNVGDDDNKNDRVVTDVAVIGGGITAAHKALELVRAKQQQGNNNNNNHNLSSIHLISRHPLKEQQFDTHQDWMMDRAASKRSEEGGGAGTPERQRKFSQSSTSWKERRMVIAKERVPGTVTPAIRRGDDGLCYAIEKGDVQWHQSEVLEKRYVQRTTYQLEDGSGSGAGSEGVTRRTRMELTLSCGDTIEVDEVVLATGFGKKLPGGKLITDLVANSGLEVSDFCGYPIVDENLAWHSRIYVTGALAELELGPSARNIAGARLAAERIILQK